MSNPKKDAKRRRREQRLAERAARFERHAALVIERQGDARYPQKTKRPDGSYTISLPPELMALLMEQRERFRTKFGRNIRPDDPLFFDPDAAEPVPVPAEHFDEVFQAFADQTDDPRMRALALASRDVGYMITEMNQHLFTAHEVEAFGSRVEKHLEESARADDLADYMNDQLSAIIEMLADGSADPDLPRFLIDQLVATDSTPPSDHAGLAISLMIVVPLKWLVAAKNSGVDEGDLTVATRWVADNFGGVDYAGPAAVVATALWGGSGLSELEQRLGKTDLTVNDLHEILGQDFAPAMMWLSAGLVATAGDGDIEWLCTMDPDQDDGNGS